MNFIEAYNELINNKNAISIRHANWITNNKLIIHKNKLVWQDDPNFLYDFNDTLDWRKDGWIVEYKESKKLITLENVQWKFAQLEMNDNNIVGNIAYKNCVFPYIENVIQVITPLDLPSKGKTKITIEYEE